MTSEVLAVRDAARQLDFDSMSTPASEPVRVGSLDRGLNCSGSSLDEVTTAVRVSV